MAGIKRFIVPEPQTVSSILDDLGEAFTVKEDRSVQSQLSFFDTFDLLVRRAGFVLCKSRLGWQLIKIKSGKVECHCSPFRHPANLFAETFPDPVLGSWLVEHIQVRMLSMVARLNKSTCWLRCLNEDEKTVARLTVVCQGFPGESEDIPYELALEVHAMRGYSQDASAVRSWARKAGYQQQPFTKVFDFSKYATSYGLQALNYDSIERPTLSSDHSVLEALVLKLAYAHEIVEANLAGIRQGKDTEFLHDYRVAIRQVRSVLSQIRDLLSPVFTISLKQDLSYLAKSTNYMRDLDVLYLAHDQFKSVLPKVLHGGLDQFHKHLSRLRQQELKKLCKRLDSPRFGMILQRWEKTIDTLRDRSELHGSVAHRPVKPVLGQLILERYRKILKAGGKIDESSPDQELHDLRLQCKKMRYLIEFAQGLFDEREVQFFVKQFRRLQNTLGRFNDESMHMVTLRQFLDDASNQQLNGDYSAAMGGLITALSNQHEKTRTEFDSGFLRIQKTKTIKRARNLFESTS